ncbi:DUF4304 domain-containing protein [Piscinibacter defluvii]|uniref:DUF4304 domain-containing protein n=1 Tax=Piscinibacter defluvii TaxID=1796922 RepID=UPI000FDF4D0E
MTNRDLRKPTLAALAQLLGPLGYRSASSLFTREVQDVVHLVEVQGSRQSIAGSAKFTVNIGILVPAAIYPDVRESTKPSVPQAHWRARLGSLSPERSDLWWQVHTLLDAELVARDVAARVEQHALPALSRLQSSQDPIALWLSGSSPGLTVAQRAELLARLLQATHCHASAA